MTALAIADIITDRLSETERVLDADSTCDWDNAKARAIALAKYEVYGSEKSESDISDGRIKEFIALKACVRLCDIGIDFLAFNRRLSDSKDGATLNFYDLVQVLNDKRDAIRAEIREKQADVLDLIDDEKLDDGSIDVSTLHPDWIAQTHRITPGPWAMDTK